MPTTTQILRCTNGVRILSVAVCLTGVILLSIHLPFGIADKHRLWIVPCYALGGLLWLADVFLTRIVLGPDSLRLVSATEFKSRTIPRAEIDTVTWEKGCGVSLILRDGTGVRLPGVGRNAQGLTNTIRAWLKRTEIKP